MSRQVKTLITPFETPIRITEMRSKAEEAAPGLRTTSRSNNLNWNKSFKILELLTIQGDRLRIRRR